MKSSFLAYKFNFLDSEFVTIVKFIKFKLNNKSLKQEWNKVVVDISFRELQMVANYADVFNLACLDERSETYIIFLVESRILDCLNSNQVLVKLLKPF